MFDDKLDFEIINELFTNLILSPGNNVIVLGPTLTKNCRNAPAILSSLSFIGWVFTPVD